MNILRSILILQLYNFLALSINRKEKKRHTRNFFLIVFLTLDVKFMSHVTSCEIHFQSMKST